jgi:hypothetical protein
MTNYGNQGGGNYNSPPPTPSNRGSGGRTTVTVQEGAGTVTKQVSGGQGVPNQPPSGGYNVHTYADQDGNIHLVQDYSQQGGFKYDTVVSGFHGGYSGNLPLKFGANALSSADVQGYKVDLNSYNSQAVPGGMFAHPNDSQGIIGSHPDLRIATANMIDMGIFGATNPITKNPLTGADYLKQWDEYRASESRKQDLINQGYHYTGKVDSNGNQIWALTPSIGANTPRTATGVHLSDSEINRINERQSMPVVINPDTHRPYSEKDNDFFSAHLRDLASDSVPVGYDTTPGLQGAWNRITYGFEPYAGKSREEVFNAFMGNVGKGVHNIFAPGVGLAVDRSSKLIDDSGIPNWLKEPSKFVTTEAIAVPESFAQFELIPGTIAGHIATNKVTAEDWVAGVSFLIGAAIPSVSSKAEGLFGFIGGKIAAGENPSLIRGAIGAGAKQIPKAVGYGLTALYAYDVYQRQKAPVDTGLFTTRPSTDAEIAAYNKAHNFDMTTGKYTADTKYATYIPIGRSPTDVERYNRLTEITSHEILPIGAGLKTAEGLPGLFKSIKDFSFNTNVPTSELKGGYFRALNYNFGNTKVVSEAPKVPKMFDVLTGIKQHVRVSDVGTPVGKNILNIEQISEEEAFGLPSIAGAKKAVIGMKYETSETAVYDPFANFRHTEQYGVQEPATLSSKVQGRGAFEIEANKQGKWEITNLFTGLEGEKPSKLSDVLSFKSENVGSFNIGERVNPEFVGKNPETPFRLQTVERSIRGRPIGVLDIQPGIEITDTGVHKPGMTPERAFERAFGRNPFGYLKEPTVKEIPTAKEVFNPTDWEESPFDFAGGGDHGITVQRGKYGMELVPIFDEGTAAGVGSQVRNKQKDLTANDYNRFIPLPGRTTKISIIKSYF